MSFKERGQAFLANNNHIAVVGVSRNNKESTNLIYRKLRDEGYDVYAVNPGAETIDGDTCYPSVMNIPALVDGAIILTGAEVTAQVVDDCIEAGVKQIWMHENAFAGASNTSVNHIAAEKARAAGIDVIDGGCPLMFFDVAHKCMRMILGAMNKLPA